MSCDFLSSSELCFSCCLFSNFSRFTFWEDSPVGFVVSWFPYWWDWILSYLHICSWLWSFVWIEGIFEIVKLSSIFPIQWFFQLLNTFVLIINSLSNQTFWSNWINLSICTWLRSFIWVIRVFKIVKLGCIFPIQWFL